MSHTGQFDYLIVGQGLAGTCLGHSLESNFNKKIFVVDRDSGKRCTRIAIGTFNPIVPRTFTTTWKSHELIPYLNNFYQDFGKKYDLNLINHRPVFKRLHSENQRKLWKDKSDELSTNPFMKTDIIEKIEGITGPFGFGEVKQSGNVEIVQFLEAFREHLKKSDHLLEESFDYNELDLSNELVEYKGIKAKKIVFCQGYENTTNPFFKEMPFSLAKGEVLIIKVPNWNQKGIIHNKINIVPMGNDLYWVGSTFDWDNLDDKVTQMGKSKLLAQIENTITLDFEVIDHVTGIRPTVKDRRPLLGEHSTFKNVYIFNGMGTRGVMLAPFFANEMVQFMENGKSLDREINIIRFSELK